MTSTHEFFQYMDGGVASFQEGVMKPGKEIFELFLERYEKDAAQCVFVDDTPINVEAAQAVGYEGIILKNIDDLAKELCRYPELAQIING